MSLSALASLGALPPLPDGAHLALSAPGWGRGVGTGGRVWPASEVLCHVLQTELSADASVLELGCGVGAVGLYAAALGASAVLTDADDACLARARENANRNSELLRGAVDVQPYRWGVAPPDGGPFSLILGADITYEARSHRALTKTLHTLVSAEAPPRVLIAHQHRPVASALRGVGGLDHFRAAARRRGLEATEISRQSVGLGVVSLLEVAAGG